jgi:molybdopterin converting factor small subunit
MTYNRPGKGTHEVNTTGATIPHNAPVLINGEVGVAVKQKGRHWNEGLVTPERIELNEQFWLIKKGIVQVTDLGTPLAKGAVVYIVPAAGGTGTPGTLTTTATGNVKFGRVVETVGVSASQGGGRGVPTGKVRIDLDSKDSF